MKEKTEYPGTILEKSKPAATASSHRDLLPPVQVTPSYMGATTKPGTAIHGRQGGVEASGAEGKDCQRQG